MEQQTQKLFLRSINSDGYGEAVKIEAPEHPILIDSWKKELDNTPVFALVQPDYAAKIGCGKWFDDYTEQYEIRPLADGKTWQICDKEMYWLTHHSPRRIVAMPLSQPVPVIPYEQDETREGMKEELRNKIIEGADKYVFDTNGHKFSNNNNEAPEHFQTFKSGATFGYQLAEQEIERLKGLLYNMATDGAIGQHTKDYTWECFKHKNNL